MLLEWFLKVQIIGQQLSTGIWHESCTVKNYANCLRLLQNDTLVIALEWVLLVHRTAISRSFTARVYQSIGRIEDSMLERLRAWHGCCIGGYRCLEMGQWDCTLTLTIFQFKNLCKPNLGIFLPFLGISKNSAQYFLKSITFCVINYFKYSI